MRAKAAEGVADELKQGTEYAAGAVGSNASSRSVEVGKCVLGVKKCHAH